MTEYVFNPDERPSVDIVRSKARFPVHRIYCVGRNYAEHAREMGVDSEREPPFFFTKPADAIVANGLKVPYPPRTRNLHHEIELVVAIGRRARDIPAESALEHVFGYAVGNDLTRRDLQLASREKGRPWDTGKAFDCSAVITAIHEANGEHVDRGRIWLAVNGEIRQEADITDLIWRVPEVVAELSTLFELLPGDLIFTGTPAGVGPLVKGDRVEAGIDGLSNLSHSIE
jgi:fumarylpyruvate hydrolase